MSDVVNNFLQGMDRQPLFCEDIARDNEAHRYYLKGQEGIEFRSCTQFVDSFFPAFEKEKVAQKLIENNQRYQGKTVESVVASWQALADEGSFVHEEIEKNILHSDPVEHKKSRLAVEWMQDCLPVERYELMPEVMIYSKELGLAGTVDLLAFDKQRERFFLVDWKTNKRINYRSYIGKKGLHEPTRHLDDCHVVKYGLQLSLYQYILEKEYGIQMRKQALVHLTTRSAKAIPCNYARSTVLSMVRYAQQHQWLPSNYE